MDPFVTDVIGAYFVLDMFPGKMRAIFHSFVMMYCDVIHI